MGAHTARYRMAPYREDGGGQTGTWDRAQLRARGLGVVVEGTRAAPGDGGCLNQRQPVTRLAPAPAQRVRTCTHMQQHPRECHGAKETTGPGGRSRTRAPTPLPPPTQTPPPLAATPVLEWPHARARTHPAPDRAHFRHTGHMCHAGVPSVTATFPAGMAVSTRAPTTPSSVQKSRVLASSPRGGTRYTVTPSRMRRGCE